MRTVDIGVNLAHASFSRDRDEVVGRAVAAGVSAMVVTGTSVRASEAALELARRRQGLLYATVGVHPHNARECDDRTLDRLRALLAAPEAVAVGECGLDYNRDFSPRQVQDRWFEAQVALAAELELPLFLHERDAHARLVEILRPYRERIKAAVVHCFTGTGDELDAYLGMDLHVGITGWISDERRGRHLRDLVGRIPLDRLMVETDAPFLLPRNLEPQPAGRRNEPCFLPHIVRDIARCIGRDADEVAEATTRTAERFFGIES
jgi:TatD DNase family protein